MRMRLCIPWLIISVAAAAWSAVAFGQPPGGFRGGFSFDGLLERSDTDKDGKITREEWQGPEQFFGIMDRNNDGSITKQEFEARMRARGGFAGDFPGGRGLPPAPARRLDTAGLLRLLDANNDGSVSREEFAKFFQRIDSNNDGSLSAEELQKALASRAGAGANRSDEAKEEGIEVGQYAPDFELQPIEPYAKLREWLGDDAPESIEEKVRLSQLIGKQPILLLFGSYT